MQTCLLVLESVRFKIVQARAEWRRQIWPGAELDKGGKSVVGGREALNIQPVTKIINNIYERV
jgi:hypothetical protein